MSMTSKIAIYLLITLCTTNTNGLHSLTGNVEAGNYSYYVLKVDGPILLQLKTIGKGNKNVKWQQDLKILSNENRFLTILSNSNK